jgi:hypothetical protein
MGAQLLRTQAVANQPFFAPSMPPKPTTPFMTALQDDEKLKLLVKIHINQDPDKCQLLWQGKAIDEVVENFPDFLAAVAKTGHRLSSKQLTSVLKEAFEGNPRLLNEFAKKMSEALSWARNKMRSVSSGAKSGPGLKAVLRAFGWNAAEAKAPCLLQAMSSYVPSSHAASSSGEIVPLSASSSGEIVDIPIDDDIEPRDEDDGAVAESAHAKMRAAFEEPAQGTKALRKHDSVQSIVSSEADAPPAKRPKAKAGACIDRQTTPLAKQNASIVATSVHFKKYEGCPHYLRTDRST